MMWWSDWGPLGWLAMFVGMVLFVIVIVAVVWALIRLLNQGQTPRSDASLEILRQRYARGEITQAEFEEAKRMLGLQ
jgi:putative membrane protein